MAVLAFLVVGIFGQLFYYYPNLPDQLTSHFNSEGVPNGWMAKSNFIIFEGIILLIIILKTTFLPLLIERMPNSAIVLPNKEFWLNEENRAETFLVFRQFFDWLRIGLIALFIAVNEFVFRANLAHQNLSNSIWLVLIFFLLFVGIGLTKFILRFRRK